MRDGNVGRIVYRRFDEREGRLHMSMGIEVGVFLAYAFAVLMVYLCGKFLLIPLRLMGRFLLSSLLGGVALILLNYFGSGWGIFVPVNLATAVIAGVLGLPGMVMLIIFFAV